MANVVSILKLYSINILYTYNKLLILQDYVIYGDSLLVRYGEHVLRKKIELRGNKRSIEFAVSGHTARMVENNLKCFSKNKVLCQKKALVMVGVNDLLKVSDIYLLIIYNIHAKYCL